jgi:hypothetical protein
MRKDRNHPKEEPKKNRFKLGGFSVAAIILALFVFFDPLGSHSEHRGLHLGLMLILTVVVILNCFRGYLNTPYWQRSERTKQTIEKVHYIVPGLELTITLTLLVQVYLHHTLAGQYAEQAGYDWLRRAIASRKEPPIQVIDISNVPRNSKNEVTNRTQLTDFLLTVTREQNELPSVIGIDINFQSSGFKPLAPVDPSFLKLCESIAENSNGRTKVRLGIIDPLQKPFFGDVETVQPSSRKSTLQSQTQALPAHNFDHLAASILVAPTSQLSLGKAIADVSLDSSHGAGGTHHAQGETQPSTSEAAHGERRPSPPPPGETHKDEAHKDEAHKIGAAAPVGRSATEASLPSLGKALAYDHLGDRALKNGGTLAEKFPRLLHVYTHQSLSPSLEGRLMRVDYSWLDPIWGRVRSLDEYLQDTPTARKIRSELAGKAVLLGDVEGASWRDAFVVPGEATPVPGSLTMACAAATLIGGPLYEIDPWWRAWLDVLLAAFILWLAARARESNAHIRERAIRLGVICAGLLGVLAYLLVAWNIIWSDVFITALVLLFHPLIEAFKEEKESVACESPNH